METYFGYIESVHDALLVIESCRLGYLHRVQRRLSEKERQSIRSGSVYVWEEEESGMRRWTDGRAWSPSRVLGSFLIYRELENKRKHNKSSMNHPSPPLSVIEGDLGDKRDHSHLEFPYKDSGLIKQSLSVTTTNNRKLHLISYYTKDHVTSGQLKVPSYDSSFSHVRIPKGLYPDMTTDLFGRHEDTRFAHLENLDVRNMHSHICLGKSDPVMSPLSRLEPWGQYPLKIMPTSPINPTSYQTSPIRTGCSTYLPSPPNSEQNIAPKNELNLPPLKLPRLPSLARMADTRCMSNSYPPQPTITPLVVPTPNPSTSEDRRQLANLSTVFTI
ncbi:Gluconate transport-inducing protein [Basidiobolus ranarum]|uniref:Gluconate transport-inducing protein n=1 Tax=Basidiobolus ranarum TaxID=34480 RepID=A0ABR2WAA3_9FUNG